MTASTDSIIKPALGWARVPIILTLLILGVQLFHFGDFTPHISLAIGILYAWTRLFSPKAIEEEIQDWIYSIEAILETKT